MEATTHNPDLLESFLLDAWDALGSFEGALHDLESISSLEALSIVTHRLKGTAALYGFEQIAKLTELIEQFLEKRERFTESQMDDILMLLQQVAVCLSSALERIAETGKEGNVGLEFSALGGAKLLSELIKTQPELFVDEKRVENSSKQASLSQQLIQFYQANQEDWSFFAPEAEENIEAIQIALESEDYESASASEATISVLFRATHTLKGAAYMVGLDPLGDLAHILEDLMVKVRDGELSFNEPVIKALKDGTSCLTLMLETSRGKQTKLEAALLQVKRDVAALLGETFEEPTTESQDSSVFKQGLVTFFKDNEDVWEYFEPELREHIEAADNSISDLTEDSSNDDALSVLFRAMHTIKGAAYMVDLQIVGHAAADLEKLSRLIQEGSVELDDTVLELFSQGNKILGQLLDLAEGKDNNAQEGLRELLGQLNDYLPELASSLEIADSEEQSSEAEQLADEPEVKEKAISIVRVGSDKLDTLMDLAGEIVTLRSRMTEQLNKLSSLSSLMENSRNRMLRTVSEFESQYLNPQLSASETSAPETSTKVSQSQRGLQSTVNELFDELEFDTYNDLNILARSVSEMSSDVSEIQDELGSFHTNVQEESNKLQLISRQLRFEISRARMVPIAQLYGLLRRLLRNTSDKSFRLETVGENVELDNAILENVSDSLLHLVRNSLVHGIESEEERLKAGKTPEGTISLKSYHRANHVYIEVADDGAGINIDRLKAKAVERGFKTQAQVDAMSHREACQLIFIAGLSTAEALSTTAGRGVGMDAVAESIKRLKGEITLHTEKGKGTSFSLKLPLTLLISDALMVDVAGQTFGFASDNIETLQTLPKASIRHETNQRSFNYQGQRLVLQSLRELLGYPVLDPDQVSVVIVRTEQGLFAFEVDQHLGLNEIVVREFNTALSQLEHISNATIAANGSVILLLDPIGLNKLSKVTAVEVKPVAGFVNNSLNILLVDDSVSVRRIISKMLSRADFNVTTAGDGQEAMEMFLKGQTFDIVLSDLEMPIMNGYELLEELRRRSDTRDLPIIIMTTRAGDKHRNLALEMGANNYFSKPIDETRLVNELKQLERQKSLQA